MGVVTGLKPLDGESTFGISETFEFLLAKTAGLEKEINEIKDVSKLKGEPGIQGETGNQGSQGDKGDPGLAGLTGRDGKDGKNGMTVVVHAWKDPPSIWHLTKKRIGF